MSIFQSEKLVITDYLNDQNQEEVLTFLTDWVTGAGGEAEHVADHDSGGGTTLVARVAGTVAGIVTIRWTSHNPDFAARGIPLVHQISVASNFRRHGVASGLMDSAENLIAARGCPAVGITVGLFDEYGPAQRMYIQRGYLPDGRGACRGHVPVQHGETVQLDHDLILWLTKDLSA